MTSRVARSATETMSPLGNGPRAHTPAEKHPFPGILPPKFWHSKRGQSLRGVLPVIQTPFSVDPQIDRATRQREIDWAFELGANGVVVEMVSDIWRLGNQQRLELGAPAL